MPDRTEPPDEKKIASAARVLRRSRAIAVLTGAGVSAESGVPTFRGSGGLWEGHSVEEVATPAAFRRDPELVWSFYRARLRALEGVVPNPGHIALADLERAAARFWLLTQNVDGLHRAAGSRNVIELHGSLRMARCVSCEYRCSAEQTGGEPVPSCPACGNLLRPDVVWFGELLPAAVLHAADEAIAFCDVMLVAGTSGRVEPAASFAFRARGRGARIVEVNLEPTPLTSAADVSLLGRTGEILPRLVRLFRE